MQAKEVTATAGAEHARIVSRQREAGAQLGAVEGELGQLGDREATLQETVRHARSRMEEARATSSQQIIGNKVRGRK